MSDHERLRAQVHECTECMKAFLQEAVDRKPELEDHAGIIREHLEALRRELDVLVERLAEKRPPEP